MMTVDDLRIVVGDITATTKTYVREVVADVQALYGAQMKALEDRIAAVQTTPGPKGDTGERGADGLPGKDAVLPDLDALAQKAAVYVPKPLDGAPGRDGVFDIKALSGDDIEVFARKAAALIPAPPLPKDGAPGRDGRDGASVTIADLVPLIDARIAAGIADAVKALPAPAPGRDGQSVTVEDIRPVMLELVQAEVAARPARDGRDGLPGVPGPPGEKGLDGINGRDGIDGRPGEKGADGADGLGINNADMTFSEDKGFAVVMSNGERSLEFRLPSPWFKGVWRHGDRAPKGAIVLFKGDDWIAKTDTDKIPGQSPDWQLIVRKGKDGKDLRNVNGTD